MQLTNRQFDYLFILLLTVVYAFSYLDAAIILDNARDFYKVEQIVTGKQLVLQGPDLAGSIHLSGWWFYWLSLVGIFKVKWLVALWVGLTAGTKFLFAFEIGKRLIGRSFGCAIVFAMALPGWQTLEQFTFSHTNIVQALTLLFILLLWDLWQKKAGHLLKWLALVFSMAVHAHPSTYGLLLFAAPFLLHLLINKTFSVKDITLAIVIALLTLLPYGIQQSMDHWRDFQTASQFGDNKLSLSRVSELLKLWEAIFWVGPQLLADVVAGSLHWWKNILDYLYISVVVLSIIGFIKSIITRSVSLKMVLLLAWALLSLSTCVLIVRDITPFYMTYVLLSVAAMIIAYGLHQVIGSFSGSRYVLLLMAILLVISPWVAMIRFSGNNELALPDFQLRQVRAKLDPNWRSQPNMKLDIISFKQAEMLDDILCKRREQQLHGPMVAVLDLTFGIATQFQCDNQQLKIAGNDSGYALLSGRLYHDLESQGIHFDKVGNYAVIDHVTPLKAVDFTLAKPDDYKHPPRSLDVSQDTIDISTTLPKKSFVMITDYLNVYRAFSIPIITVNGQTLQPIAGNYYTRIYQCEACQMDAQWTINIHNVNAKAIDIVHFELD